MNRRGFICSLATTGLAPMLPARVLVLLLPAIPILYGDGIHDDAAALEVALNGGAVNWADGQPVGDVIHGMRFLCGSTITVKELRRSLISNFLIATPELERGQAPMLAREAA